MPIIDSFIVATRGSWVVSAGTDEHGVVRASRVLWGGHGRWCRYVVVIPFLQAVIVEQVFFALLLLLPLLFSFSFVLEVLSPLSLFLQLLLV